MVKRIAFSVLLITSVTYFPIWLSGILMLVGMFYFDYYWEPVIVFFMSDMFLGVKIDRFQNFFLVESTAALLAFVLIEFLKTKLKFYNNKK